MTLPTIVPVGFQATSKDFLKAKVSRDGAAFLNRGVVTVPSGTVTGTIIGLIPFQNPCTFSVPALSVLLPAMGASVTASLGIIYDDNIANTNVANLYANASTTAAAGGALTIAPTAANLQYFTTGNGWLAITTGGATTATTGDINVQALLDYFNGGVQA